MLKLAVVRILPTGNSNSRPASAWCSMLATCKPFCAGVSGRIRANSSPPSRASTSPRRNRFGQHHGQFLEHHVADGMTEGIVDVLEVIQVDHDHRESVLMPLGANDFVLQELMELAPVVQAGERIANRQLFQFGVVFLYGLEQMVEILGQVLDLGQPGRARSRDGSCPCPA